MNSPELKPKLASPPDIDRKQLKTVKQRFLQVNAERLLRARSALAGRHQIFIDLLPLLFHINHPRLPGYISLETPCGLSGYTPDKAQLRKAQQLIPGFSYRHRAKTQATIDSIFLMGSCGSVAQSEKSDLDIWVCHPAIDGEQQQQLRKKCDAITEWAASLGLEAHIFLMTDEKFRRGERESLSTEDCGSAQHYLLLDEFYRTSLLVAGRIPIWWLVPPEHEANYRDYTNRLRHNRFVSADETLDFGSVNQIPAEEFVSAGMWQLYKAIDSPYKSVIKILLAEIYATEYPSIAPLSTDFKSAVYRNAVDVDELDPYVRVYRRLERHLLARHEHQRLDLIRRCFYFKVGISLSRASVQHKTSWQWRLMNNLTSQWQWPRQQLASLDSRYRWKIEQVGKEQKLLVTELINSYRSLINFARYNGVSSLIHSSETAILGRRLYAAFERRSGKVEWINPGISQNMVESQLTFYQTEPASYDDSSTAVKHCWAISTQPDSGAEALDSKPIRQSDNLVSLLAWCHFNSLLDESTRITLVNNSRRVSEFELQNIIHSMRQYLPTARQQSEHFKQFERGAKPVHLQLFINVGVDPLTHSHQRGIERISNTTDSLSFGGLKENLILNIEQVQANSWGELSCKRFEGNSALINCIKAYLQMLIKTQHEATPQLSVHCFCPSRARAIAKRIAELLESVKQHFSSKSGCGRYVLEVQRQFYIIQQSDQQIQIEQAGDTRSLIKKLAAAQSRYCPFTFDPYCLTNSPLTSIAKQNRPNRIEVFYRRHRNSTADLYITDERGSLFHLSTPFYSQQNLLLPLDQFIQSMLLRRNSSSQFHFALDINDQIRAMNLNDIAVDYFEILADNSLRPCKVNRDFSQQQFFNVQAIAHEGVIGEPMFTIYCDNKEFTELEYGAALFENVARYILSRRTVKERYPCYITDLDLSHADTPQQTVLFFQQKQRLEQLLNRALQAL